MAVIRKIKNHEKAIKIGLFFYTAVLFVVVALLQGTVVLGNAQVVTAQANNCCNDSSWVFGVGGSCDNDAEWEQGYYACVAGSCSICQGGGPVCGNNQCEAGEDSQNCSADCGSTTPTPTPTPNPQQGRCTVADPSRACSRITNYAGVNGEALVEQAARNNPGTQYMVWCDIVSGKISASTSNLSTCGCPTLSSNGGLVTGRCGECDNPTAIFQPTQQQQPPTPPAPPPTPPTPPPTPQTPGIEVIKDAIDGEGARYLGGSLVPFRIVIRNTGQTTHTNVYFSDSFNTNYLDFVTIFGQKTGGAQVNLGSVAVVNELTLNGTVVINNLAAANALGSLAPGQTYTLTMNFIAKAPIDRTCNDVYVRVGTTGPNDQDNACVGVNPPNTDL